MIPRTICLGSVQRHIINQAQKRLKRFGGGIALRQTREAFADGLAKGVFGHHLASHTNDAAVAWNLPILEAMKKRRKQLPQCQIPGRTENYQIKTGDGDEFSHRSAP